MLPRRSLETSVIEASHLVIMVMLIILIIVYKQIKVLRTS